MSVVVIGAGQAGLSVSYYLRRFGLTAGSDFVILDRNSGPGGAWRHRWESLRLGTAHRVHDLPGMDEMELSFDAADRRAPARDIVADYYGRFEEYFDLRVRRPVAVTRVFDRNAELVLRFRDLTVPDADSKAAVDSPPKRLLSRLGRRNQRTSSPQDGQSGDGEMVTRFLVNATGTWGAPFVPWYRGANTFAGRQLHTADYVSAEEFRNKRVVVVGGGTSAIGFMLELEDAASALVWVSRRPIDWVDTAELDLEGASAAVAMQDEAARSGRALPSIVSGTGVPKSRRIASGIRRGLLVPKPMFTSIEPGGVRWEDGSFFPADAILWATGFRPELRHLAPLKLREKSGGVTVGQGASWADPRIFLAGYGPQASTIGANRAGRMIARQIMALL